MKTKITLLLILSLVLVACDKTNNTELNDLGDTNNNTTNIINKQPDNKLSGDTIDNKIEKKDIVQNVKLSEKNIQDILNKKNNTATITETNTQKIEDNNVNENLNGTTKIDNSDLDEIKINAINNFLEKKEKFKAKKAAELKAKKDAELKANTQK
ncbi:MAG: hypothetical protein PHS49_00790 [Candidatus Gracilibacteria bacterium]|nr:hypothetical protein [Candidatus Gracilibacteria bacterium]